MSLAEARPSRLAGLDGLRAVAAISVLTYHVALGTKFVFSGPLAPVVWELKGGVAVFFVISGVVLYLPYARALRDRRPFPDWRVYAWRRAVRILPAYWIAVTAAAVLPFAAGVLGPNFMRYYSLSQIYSPDSLFGGLGGAWSLCVEVSFYALMPVLARLAARLAQRAGSQAPLRAQLAVLALCGLGSIGARGLLADSVTAPIHNHGVVLATALPGFLDWFAIGMGLAVLAAEWEAGRGRVPVLATVAGRPGRCALLALVAFGLGVPAQHGDIFLPWYGLLTHLALGAGSGLLVLAAIDPGHGRGSAFWIRLLRGRWMTWLGTISYGIYLWNTVVLELISRHPGPRTLSSAVVLWMAVLDGTLVLAAASWYLVERPSQRLLRAYERRAQRGGGPGRSPETAVGVQTVADGLNPSGVAVDHLA